MRFFLLNPGSAARFGAGFAYLSVLLLTIPPGLSQTPVLKTRTKEQRDEMYAGSHRITMNVQVSDSTGNPVADLAAGDFAIYDNQQPRKIAAFHPIDGAAMFDATRVVILLDAVNSPAEALDAEKAGIFKYLAASHKPFRFPTSFALWFNGHLNATGATMDRNVVGRAFVSMTKGLHSNACADENANEQKITVKAGNQVDPATCRAVHFRDSIAALDGIAQQQQAGGGRTLLIWVGKGWPVLSSEEFWRLPPKDQREYAQEFMSLAHDLRAGQVTLYSISRTGGTDQATGDSGAASRAHVGAPGSSPNGLVRHLALHELAPRTGGRVMAGSQDIAADLGACERDAEWYYALSFNAPPSQNGPGELHSLEIKVNRPGLQVRTMTAYYAEP